MIQVPSKRYQVAGTILGAGVAEILIVVLQGVFDPPPEAPAVPIILLLVSAFAFAAATAVAVIDATVRANRGVVSQMREGR